MDQQPLRGHPASRSGSTVIDPSGDVIYDDASLGPVSITNGGNPGVPTLGGITWGYPADITYGIALSSAQLNATAGVAGSFAYSPASGAVLGAGNNQTLSVTFTPTDTTESAMTQTVSIPSSGLN